MLALRLRRFCRAIIVFLLIPAGEPGLDYLDQQGRDPRRPGGHLGVILGDQVLMWLAVARVAALLGAYPAAFYRCSGWARSTWPGWAAGCSWPKRARRRCCTSSRTISAAGLHDHAAQSQGDRVLHAFFPLFVDPARIRADTFASWRRASPC